MMSYENKLNVSLGLGLGLGSGGVHLGFGGGGVQPCGQVLNSVEKTFLGVIIFVGYG